MFGLTLDIRATCAVICSDKSTIRFLVFVMEYILNKYMAIGKNLILSRQLIMDISEKVNLSGLTG